MFSSMTKRICLLSIVFLTSCISSLAIAQAVESNEPDSSNEAVAADSSQDEQTETVTTDISNAWSTVDRMVDGFVALIPNLIIAAVFFGIVLLVAWGVRWAIVHYTNNRESENLGRALGRLAQWALILIGLMIAVAIVAPSVTPAKLLGALGVGSVAIGFAFKDLLQNFMAGILILLRQPFRVNDQVVLGDHEGTVESIDTRATVIKTYDGTRVLIPNGQVYTNPMKVLTAYEHRRSEYDVGIGYGDDLRAAAEKMLETLRDIKGVLSEPAPEVLVVELAGSTVNLRARWWTDPRRSDVVHVQSDVIAAIKERMDDEAIDMPFPTQVMLFHDQTEETDGDRTKQREGWPAGKNPPKAARQIGDASGNNHRQLESANEN